MLLFNAAPQNIKNNQGETPLDMALNMSDQELGGDIVSLFKQKQGLMQYFQLSSPLQKVERSYSMTVAFFLLNIGALTFSALFIFPIWTHSYEIWITVSLFVLANLFFIITMCSDPGFIKSNPDIDFLVSELYFILLKFISFCLFEFYRNSFN